MDAALHALLTYRKYSFNRCRMHFEAINLLQSAVTYFSRIYRQTDRQTEFTHLEYCIDIDTVFSDFHCSMGDDFDLWAHPPPPVDAEPDGHIPLNLTVATVQSGMRVPCPSSR